MNKLAKYIIGLAVAAIIAFLVWYFRNIIIYILVAAVLSLIGRPLVNRLTRLSIKKIYISKGLAAFIVLLLMMAVVTGIFWFVAPLAGELVTTVTSLDLKDVSVRISGPLLEFNNRLHDFFPDLDPAFSIETFIWQEVEKIMNPAVITGLFGSVASFLGNLAIAVFSVIFITFFFLKEQNMFGNMIGALVPEKYEEKLSHAMRSAKELLFRYFVGLVIELFIMTVLITIGLFFISRINFHLAVVLGFVFGIMNIIPYVGPLLGGSFGVIMALATAFGPSGYSSVLLFIISMVAVYVGSNMLDTYLIQPYIYSNSVKAHPLEIFLVILISGYLGGPFGMLVAIPAYNVIRVFASEFLSRFKIVKRLTGIN
jgi:predicted PurR-regulated permease PerM